MSTNRKANMERDFKDDLSIYLDCVGLLQGYPKGTDRTQKDNQEIQDIKDVMAEIQSKVRDDRGNTLLHLAVEQNNEKMVKLLTDGPSDLVAKAQETQNIRGDKPIDLLAKQDKNPDNNIYSYLSINDSSPQELYNRFSAAAVTALAAGDKKEYQFNLEAIAEVVGIAEHENKTIDMNAINPDLKMTPMQKALENPKTHDFARFLVKTHKVQPTAGQAALLASAHATVAQCATVPMGKLKELFEAQSSATTMYQQLAGGDNSKAAKFAAEAKNNTQTALPKNPGISHVEPSAVKMRTTNQGTQNKVESTNTEADRPQPLAPKNP